MDRDSYRGASGQVVSDDSSDSDSHSSSDSASLEGSTRDRRRANFFRQLHEVGQRGTTCDELSNPDAGADSNASSSIGPQRNRRRENFIRRYREVNITPLVEKHKQSLYDPTSILYPGSHRPLPRPEGSHSGFAQVKEGNPSSSQILPSNAPSVGGSSQAPGSHRIASHSSEDKSPQVFSSNSRDSGENDVPEIIFSPTTPLSNSHLALPDLSNIEPAHTAEEEHRLSSPDEVATLLDLPDAPIPAGSAEETLSNNDVEAIDVDTGALPSPSWGSSGFEGDNEQAVPSNGATASTSQISTPPLASSSGMDVDSNHHLAQQSSAPPPADTSASTSDMNVDGDPHLAQQSSAHPPVFPTTASVEGNGSLTEPTGLETASSKGAGLGVKRKRSDFDSGSRTTNVDANVKRNPGLKLNTSKPPDVIISPSADITTPDPVGQSAGGLHPSNTLGDDSKSFPPEMSDLLTHLARTVSRVVTKAYEEGMSSGRDAASLADRSRAPPAGNNATDCRDSIKTAANGGEDGSIGNNDSSGANPGPDPDCYPKLRGKQRRRTGKRESIRNTFHLEIRTFLELHGVYPPRDDPRYLPPCVSEAQLERFASEGKTAGPKVNDPSNPFSLNWNASLTHDSWNIAAIRLLAQRLHILFVARKDKKKFEGLRTDFLSLRKNIITRLNPIRTSYRKTKEKRDEDGTRGRTRMRQASRRKNRNSLRKKILKYQKSKHKTGDLAKVWSDAADVAYILDGNGRNTADGDSEDESETETDSDGRSKKIVRVLRRDWINKDIPKLMHAVDSYEQDCLDDVGRQHQGNSSYKRVFISKNADKRRYMSGLPRNFYDDVWYKELDEAEKSLVNAEDRFVNIPKLTPYVRQSST